LDAASGNNDLCAGHEPFPDSTVTVRMDVIKVLMPSLLMLK
jgi:hypothetical protein